MAEFRTRRRVLAAKIESVVGTPETLAGADANFLIYDAKFDPVIELFNRNPNRQTLSPLPGVPGVQMGQMTGKVEVKGSGTAGTAPAIGKLLRACGMTETINAGTSVVYTPTSALAPPSLTIGVFMDGIRKQIAGARGTFTLTVKLGEILMMDVTYKGLLTDEVDAAAPTQAGLETTLPAKLLALPAFTIAGFSPKISSCALSLNNQLTMRPDIAAVSGYAGCLITSRDPGGSMDPEDELVATHPFFTRWKNGTTGALNLQVGNTAGNIVTISAPALQYTNQKEGEREALATRPTDFKLCASSASGDDELVLTFT